MDNQPKMKVRMSDGTESERPVASMERDDRTGMTVYHPELRDDEEAIYTVGSSRPMIVKAGGDT